MSAGEMCIRDSLEENEATLVVVSGGKGSNEPVSEAQGMFDYLVAKGIAPERIVMEDKSTNTKENLEFSQKLIPEAASVGIVTNNFHVYRGTRLAVKQGFRTCLLYTSRCVEETGTERSAI